MMRRRPDFWGSIDTSLRAHRRACDCHRSRGMAGSESCPPNCASWFEWEYERVGCIARNGDGGKCNELAGRDFPFCQRYHEDRAIRAFVEFLGADSEGWGGTVGRAKSDLTRTFARIWVHCYYERELTDREKVALRGIFDLGKREDAERAKPVQQQVACSLYRHYDADGVLLYIGITVDPPKRLAEHEKSSPWWRFVQASSLEWFESTEAAASAERRLIRDEAPIFNKAGATDERSARAVTYLVENGALDLLRAVA